MPVDPILPPLPPETQPDRKVERPAHAGRSPLLLRSPLFLALVVTAANAIKPVMIDDAAYLAFARHIAAAPLDPYGFRVFWYSAPQAAMQVLAPPVVPYWLAAGIRLFGEHPMFLKLWMFPFVWLFAWAVRELLRRFARGTESRLLPLLVLSPAVLPTVNLMLDIPALALGLAAVVLFARASDRGSWLLAVAAGIVAGSAMQAKYTALLVPPAVAWYGLTHRRVLLATAAVFMAVAVFAGWEWLVCEKYGTAHFLYHVDAQSSDRGLDVVLDEKADLGAPLAGHLGCLGIGVGLVGGFALGLSRRVLATLAVIWAVGVALIVLVPYRWTVIIPGRPPDTIDVTAVMAFWQSFGVLVLVSLAGCGVLLALRFGKGLRVRANPDVLFLLGWLLIELAGYFALTPFGAARRVIGLTVVGCLLAGRVLSRVERIRPERKLPSWVIVFGVVAGIVMTAIDTLDGFPEKVCTEQCVAVVAGRPAGAAVWYAGHWGFQFYCERAGMRPVVPGESVLKPGDVLVLPVAPDPIGLYRPNDYYGPPPPQPEVADEIAVVMWEDPLSAQTVPNFYCGIDPLVGRDHPRLRVVVYRIQKTWEPGR